MNRFFILVTVLSLGMFSLFAQAPAERPNYKLLWKISGKDLKSPSYLFGTMHVQDKKAFDFSDSVLLKISECKAFALEIHPDSIVNAVMSMALKSSKTGANKFKDILNKEDYSELDSLLKKKTGYSLEKLKSPTMAEIVLHKRYGKKDKKVFLDAYLYDIARRQGKTIMGVEDVSDQMSLLDFQSSEDIRKMMFTYLKDEGNENVVVNPYRDMLDNYYQGDIDKLRSLIKDNPHLSDDVYRRIITNRNIKMVGNIKKAIAVQSTFIAVGAGHLAGEEGLIRLLQSEGYTVTPVKPAFTGLAAKYKFEPVKEEWYHYASEKEGYAVDMPQKPFPLLIDSLGLTFQMYFDLGSSTLFQVAYFPMSEEFHGKPGKDIFDITEQNIKQTGKIDKRAKIIVNGLEGREFTFIEDGNYFRSRLILRGEILYLLIVGITKEATASADAQKFFDSFAATELKPEQWKELVSEEGAFSINMLGDAKKETHEIEGENGVGKYRLNIYSSMDMQNQESYLVRYNDFPAGTVSNNDSVYYASLTGDIYERMKGKALSQKEITVQGFKASEFVFQMAENILVKGRLCLRGNRLYMLLTTSLMTKPESKVDEFMNSLKFIGYQTTQLKEYELKGDGITIKLPSDFDMDTTDTEDYTSSKKRKIFNSIDPNSGISYILTIDPLSKYDYYTDKESFLEDMSKASTNDGDSIIYKKDVSTKDYVAQDITFSSTFVNASKRFKIILRGKNIYMLIAYLPRDYASTEVANQFFDSPKFTGPKDSWDAFASKSDLILKDIASEDTLVQEEAMNSLRTYNFQKADLPKIYKVLSVDQPNDSLMYGGIRSRLFQVLGRVNDSTTIDFIKGVYTKLPGDSSQLRDDALSVLGALKNKEAALEMLSLLSHDKDKIEFNSYKILHSFYDSLQLLNHITPDIINLQSRFNSPFYIFDLTKAALDSSVFSPEVAKDLETAVIDQGKVIAAELSNTKEDEDNYFKNTSKWSALADLLSSIHFNDEVKNIVLALHKSGDVGTMVNTSCILLKNNMPVDANDLVKIASAPLYRIILYERLKEIGKEKAFPAKYLKQEKFAESALYESFEDGEPDKIELIGIKHVYYEDSKQNLYVYKYKYEGDENWSLGISGPFPIKSKEVVLRGDLTNYSYEGYEKGKLDEAIKDLLEETGAELVK